MHRRHFLTTATASALSAPSFLLAHAGHGAGHIVMSASVTKQRGSTLYLVVTLFNQGTFATTLYGATVEGAEVLQLDEMVLARGALAESLCCVRFEGDIPGIFTLMMDFGDHGTGPVTVTL